MTVNDPSQPTTPAEPLVPPAPEAAVSPAPEVPAHGAGGAYASQPSYAGADTSGQSYPGASAYGAAPLPPTAQAYQPAPGGGYGYATMEQNSLGNWALGLAIGSFVFLGLLLSVPAVILGRKGMRAADEGRATNRGIAQAGFIVGVINIALSVLGVLFFVLLMILGVIASTPGTV